MNLLQQYNKKTIDAAATAKEVPDFRAGDTLRVHVKIVEGSNERIQMYEGVCLGRKNRGIGSTFMVRKISNGEGVERTFLLYSPRVAKIEVVRTGKVRQGKIYYMRNLRGKAARIKERVNYAAMKQEKASAKKAAKKETKAVEKA